MFENIFGKKRLFKKKFPTAEEFYDNCRLKEDIPYTPDITQLEERQSNLLFIYGEEQTRHPKNDLLGDDAKRIAVAFTRDPFTLWKKKLGSASYPIALRHSFGTVPLGKLRGELYAVSPKAVITLDNTRENGVQYVRERVRIILPYTEVSKNTLGVASISKEKVFALTAWAYVGVNDYWLPQLDGGYCFKSIKPHTNYTLGRYYCYSTMEYKDV